MFFLITVGLFVASVALWIRWRSKQFTYFKDLGIPGPEPSMVFGNAWELLKRKDLITCQNEWIKKYGDVVGYYFGSLPCLLVARPDLIKQILVKDFASFTDRPDSFFGSALDDADAPFGQHMINLKGKRWKEVRSLLTPTFTSGKLKQMLSMLQGSVGLTMSKLEKATTNGSRDVEMYSLFKGMTVDAIGRTAFGIEVPVQDNPDHPLMRLTKLIFSFTLTSYTSIFFISFRELKGITHPISKLFVTLLNKGTNPLGELFNICGDVVKTRKENPSLRRPDLLQTVIDARSSGGEISDQSLEASSIDDTVDVDKSTNGHINEVQNSGSNLRKLNDTEIQANAFLYFLAGYETTSTTLAFITHQLLNNLDAQSEMRKECFDVFGKNEDLDYDLLPKLHYTDRFIMEALRMNPAIIMFQNRVANRTVQLGEYTIPKGIIVQIPIHNVHYNPELYSNPNKFNPDRFLPENRSTDHSMIWLPFGTGPRNCVGMRFALLEIKLALVKILRKYKLEPCAKTELGGLEIEYSIGINRPKNGIHAKVTRI